MTKAQLRQLLAEGKTEQLIAALRRPEAGLDPDFQHEITLISGRYERLAHQRRVGLLDVKDENRELADINAALMGILDRLEKQADLLPPPVTELTISCTTDKGNEAPTFARGHTMRLFFKVSAASIVRAIYQLADGRLVLLTNDQAVPAEAAERWLEIGDGFEVAEPLGEEQLFVFAQNEPFQPLATRLDADGYLFITDGLPDSLQKTRGFKKKTHFAESSLALKTQ